MLWRFGVTFPTLTIHATPDLAEACRVGANAEVLVALAHQVSDKLIAAMRSACAGSRH